MIICANPAAQFRSYQDEIEAAVLKVLRSNAIYWVQKLKPWKTSLPITLALIQPLGLLRKRGDCEHVHHLFVIKTNDRELLQDDLGENGTSTQYPVPTHKQAYYMCLAKNRSLPMAEKLAKEIVSLPMYPELSLEEIKRVIDLIKEFYHGQASLGRHISGYT